MTGVLTGRLCGWPQDRLLTLGNVRSPGDLADQLITAFEDITEVALFYYVGHGQIDSDDQLCLGLVDARSEHNRRAATSLPFQAVRKALLESRAATKIVILDCCFSGLASQPDNTLTMHANNVLDITAGAGAYTMAASGAYNTAWYETGPSVARPQTYFTKYLADLIETGMPGLPSVLSLHMLFTQLAYNLVRDKRPTPVVRSVDAARDFIFAHNAAAPSELHPDLDLERQWIASGFGKAPRSWKHSPSRWRSRRKATLGGSRARPVGVPEVEPFIPARVDEAAALRALEGLAAGLSSGGMGDSPVHLLNTLIDALTDQWTADIRAQHARYVARVTPMLEAAEASVREAAIHRMRDRSILEHKALALETALLRIVGGDRMDRHKADHDTT